MNYSLNLDNEIAFHSEGISFALVEPKKIQFWLKEVASQEMQNISLLNYIFCSDPYLHQINLEYLQHDTFTDVITFPYSERKNEVEGDIFISIDRIEENAKTFQACFEDELYRVMVHGLLHLLGYGDKNPEEKEKMTFKENFYLKQIH